MTSKQPKQVSQYVQKTEERQGLFALIETGNIPFALIECENGEEMISACDKDGKARIYETQGTDLMMLPEKKEGWVNLCKNNSGDTLAVGVFPNREEAVSNCPPSYLCTIKIEWEE